MLIFLQIHSWKDLDSFTNIMSTPSDVKQRYFSMHILLELMYMSLFKKLSPSLSSEGFGSLYLSITKHIH